MKKPAIVALVSGLVGILLGLLWAWQVQPVVWTDVPPTQLGNYYQEEYLRMAIDSSKVNGNVDLAISRYQALGPYASGALAAIVKNPGDQDPAAILSFANLVQSLPTPTPVPGGASQSAGKNPILSYAIIIVAVLAVLGVGYALIRFLRPMRRGAGLATPAQQARDLSRQVEMTDYAAMGEESPIAQFVTTYVLGDDLFDDSFSIDSPAGEFLGECGIGISETIGVGDPKKVTAFEVWLFDKNDIQTVTKVLMSAHAFNDVATYQRLEAKGEPILIERGKQIVLETAALQLVATVSDQEYGQSALPAESYFERLTLEIAVWPKVTAPA